MPKLSKLVSFLKKIPKKKYLLILFLFIFSFTPFLALSAEEGIGAKIGGFLKSILGKTGSIASASLIGEGTEIINATLSRVINALIVAALIVPLAIANIFLTVSVAVLNLVKSPLFINLSYTGMDNPVIKLGWTLTRDLANMGIVIALIVIGLATILRREGYEAKKALPLLIIIALLINFTPVILGIIVDASNILMNHLLEGFSGFDIIGAQFKIQQDNIYAAFRQNAEEIGYHPAALAVAHMFFAVIAGLVLLLFSVLFIMRYVAIWIAVILSPLAFVAYILPKTRNFFSMWWKQFIAWCLIGIIAAFFLWLSGSILQYASDPDLYLISPEARLEQNPDPTDPTIEGFLDKMLPYGIVIIFLIIGFFMAISVSAMGASQIVSASKKGGQMAGRGGKLLSRQTLGRFASSKPGKKVGRWLARRQARVSDRKTLRGKGVTALTTPFRWASRKAGNAFLSYGVSVQDKINDEKDKIKKKFKGDYKSMAAYVSSLSDISYEKRIAGAQALSESKGAKGLNALSERELKKIIKQTGHHAPKSLDNLVKHKPELINDEEVGEIIMKHLINEKGVIEQMKSGVDKATAKRRAAFKEAVNSLKTSEVENLSNQTLENEEFQEAVAKYKPWAFIRKIGEEKGGKHVANIQEAAQKRVGLEEIARTNPSLLKAAYTPGGQAYLNQWTKAEGESETITTKENIDKFIRESSLSPEEERKREQRAREKYQSTEGEGKGGVSGRRAGGSSQGRRSGGNNPQGRRA